MHSRLITRRSLLPHYLNTNSHNVLVTTTFGLPVTGTTHRTAITGCRAHGFMHLTRERFGHRVTGTMIAIAIVTDITADTGVAISVTMAALIMALDTQASVIRVVIGMATALITTARSTT